MSDYVYTETYYNGGYGVLTITNCPSRREADAEALRMGWKPPRWWQWWRWSDTPRRAEAQP